MSRKRTIALVAALIAASLAVVVTRAVWEGRSALARGEEALATGDSAEAVRQWRRAARWYVPLAPHVGDAYDRLEEVARAAEAGGDRDLALAAWRGIRRSVLATRSFYTPQEHRLEEANRRIAALMAAVEGPAADPERDVAEREAWHLALLERPVGPSVFWSIVAIAGFFLWIGGAFWFAWSGVSDKDRLVRSVAARAGVLVVLGLVIWLIGLTKA